MNGDGTFSEVTNAQSFPAFYNLEGHHAQLQTYKV